MAGTLPISVAERRLTVTRWDLLAVLLVLGVMVFLAEASRHLLAPLADLQMTPISLDPANLPDTPRAPRCACWRRWRCRWCSPSPMRRSPPRTSMPSCCWCRILDILQSVPILGFISVTAVFFMSLGAGTGAGRGIRGGVCDLHQPGLEHGVQLLPVAAHRADRTGRSVASSFRLSPWMRFWRLDVPFAMPQLIFNMMLSMSGSWFFVVASEAISVGNTTITLPGVGSYIALAIEQRSLAAVAWAIVTMLVVILLYDQLLFRPLVAWSDRFRFEQEAGALPPRSWVLDVLRRSGVVAHLGDQLSRRWRRALPRRLPRSANKPMVVWPGRDAPLDGLVVDRRRCGRGARRAWQIGCFVAAGPSPRSKSWGCQLARCDPGARGRTHRDREPRVDADRSRVGTRPRLIQFVQPVAQFLAALPREPAVSDRYLRHRGLQLIPNIGSAR